MMDTNKSRELCVGSCGSKSSCNITTYEKCNQQKCAFYKTKEVSETDRRKSFEHRYAVGGPFTEFDREYLFEAKKAVG